MTKTTKTNPSSQSNPAPASPAASSKTSPAAATKPSDQDEAEARRRARRAYIKLKKHTLESEKGNYTKLIFIHDRANWWKLFGHSAVIFYYEVAEWIHYSCKLRSDTDYEAISKEGVVNIRDIYALDKKLAAFNINLLHSSPDYRVYNIGKKFTEGDIQHMQKERDAEWAKVNHIVLPKEVFPTLFSLERDLFLQVFYTAKKLDSYTREYVMNPVVERVVGLLRDYSILANGDGLTPTGYLDRVYQEMHWCRSQLVALAELRAVETKKMFHLLHLINQVEREVAVCQPKKTKLPAKAKKAT